MQESISPVFAGTSERQRFVNAGQGCFRTVRYGFDVSEQTFEQRQEDFVSLILISGNSLPKLHDSSFKLAESRV
jgi:hypothetical protein